MSAQPAHPDYEPRPSDTLSDRERQRALKLLRNAHILAQPEEPEAVDARPDEALALDAYVVSGNRIPNRMVGSAEPIMQVPDATSTEAGRVTLRRLRRGLEDVLDLPPQQRAIDPYPEPEA